MLKTALISSLVTLALVAAVFGGFVVAGTSASSPGSAGVAYFREHVIAYNTTGPAPAQTEAWRTEVLLLKRQQVIGTGGIACIRVTRRVRECYGTYVLPEGRIKIEGEISDRLKFQLVIIGGTGTYTNASGVASFAGLNLVTFFLT